MKVDITYPGQNRTRLQLNRIRGWIKGPFLFAAFICPHTQPMHWGKGVERNCNLVAMDSLVLCIFAGPCRIQPDQPNC